MGDDVPILGALVTLLKAMGYCYFCWCFYTSLWSYVIIMVIRAEWKTSKSEMLKFSGRLWTTSPSWYQNSFRNHDRTIILLRNWANRNYRTRCTPPETCVLACTDRKNSRVLFSIGIVCPNIEKAREVEKIEFECLGAMQGPVHSKCVRACVHRPLHDPLTLEFNFSNWYCIFYVRKDYASWK